MCIFLLPNDLIYDTYTHPPVINSFKSATALGGRTQSYSIWGHPQAQPPGVIWGTYIPLKSIGLHNPWGPRIKIICNVLIVFALNFSKLKVEWSRRTPGVMSWKDTPWACMGIHGCTSLLCNNVCFFLCLLCFKKKKPKKIVCGLLSLSPPDQSQVLVALPQDWWYNRQGFSKEIQAAESLFASPILSDPEGPLPESCPAKPK